MRVWLIEKAILLHTWISPVAAILFGVCVAILLPMAIFKKTRTMAGTGMFFSSYIFGLAVWLQSAAVALIIWGIWAVIGGLILFGIGVVPVAILASLFNGQWEIIITIVIGIAITFGFRFFGATLLEKQEEFGGREGIERGYMRINDGLADDRISYEKEGADWDIIGAYGEVLEKFGEEGQSRLLRPHSELPYPKQQIDLALRRALETEKDENILEHLETALVCLEDFIPDYEIPDNPDEHFALWLSRKDWKDPKTIRHFVSVLSRVFIEKYGDDAEQKMKEFFEDLKKE